MHPKRDVKASGFYTLLRGGWRKYVPVLHGDTKHHLTVNPVVARGSPKAKVEGSSPLLLVFWLLCNLSEMQGVGVATGSMRNHRCATQGADRNGRTPDIGLP